MTWTSAGDSWSISSSRLPHGCGAAACDGVMTRTRSQPAARSALVPDRTPPSMKRRPLMVTGGQTPGTAQLAATASTRSTPESLVNTTGSPVSASTAVTRRFPSGQWPSGNRAATARRRVGSLTVGVSSARVPIRRRMSSGPAAPVAAVTKRAMSSSRSSSTSSSLECSLSWAEYRSSIGDPLVICAATADPAEVPMTTSAPRRPANNPGSPSPIPRSTPSSQAIPATPPPARTRARFTVTTLLVDRAPSPSTIMRIGAPLAPVRGPGLLTWPTHRTRPKRPRARLLRGVRR